MALCVICSMLCYDSAAICVGVDSCSHLCEYDTVFQASNVKHLPVIMNTLGLYTQPTAHSLIVIPMYHNQQIYLTQHAKETTCLSLVSIYGIVWFQIHPSSLAAVTNPSSPRLIQRSTNPFSFALFSTSNFSSCSR